MMYRANVHKSSENGIFRFFSLFKILSDQQRWTRLKILRFWKYWRLLAPLPLGNSFYLRFPFNYKLLPGKARLWTAKKLTNLSIPWKLIIIPFRWTPLLVLSSFVMITQWGIKLNHLCVENFVAWKTQIIQNLWDCLFSFWIVFWKQKLSFFPKSVPANFNLIGGIKTLFTLLYKS